MTENHQFDIQQVNWPEVIAKVTAYAHGLIKKYKWFRKKRPESFVEGKQAEDYAYEAIEQFLQHPEKYDPTKRTLAGYLKMHIVRHLIDNDAKSAENKLNKDVYAKKNGSTDEQHEKYLDSILPYTDDFTIEKMDAEIILKDIEQQIKGDEDGEKIFLGVVCCHMKRREVCAEFQLTEKQFDNGIRRLETALQKTIKKLEIQKP